MQITALIQSPGSDSLLGPTSRDLLHFIHQQNAITRLGGTFEIVETQRKKKYIFKLILGDRVEKDA